MLLSIDTSAGTSAAIFNGEKLLSSVFFDDPFGHAENIAGAITEVLSQANVAANALENIAVG
ncbi:MAG: hypothetical protein ACO3S8_03550, partial [Aquiluna sp.]